MRAYIIRRLLLLIPTIFLITLIVFFTIRLIPGDVIAIMASEVQWLTGKGEEALRKELGLDVPIHVQYFRWVGGILRGDLGESLWTRRPVIEEIAPKIPVSFELGLMAIIFSQLIALPIGLISAIRQDTWGDFLGRSVAILMIALPAFWLGTLVMVYPAIWWGWSPPMEYIPFSKDPPANLAQFILPAFLLGMVMSGTTMRMTRTMMLEVLRQDYIRTAWAKGLRERVVIVRHALKNALIPVITIVGLNLPVIIGGSIILEEIFVLPGIGRLTVNVINQRDYTMLSGINMMVAIVVLLFNLVIDLTYAYVDPRVQYK